MKSTNDLVRIVSNQGGLILDAAGKSTDDLVRIASNAAAKGSRIVLKNADRKSTDDLVRIASNGKGVVSFDFSD